MEFVSHLTLQQGRLVGSVTNTLSYPLSDAYVLISNQYLSLGQLASGQTKQVNLVLNNTNNGQNISLADQIAASKGVHISYGSSNRTQMMSETQRRIMMLATLSGENGYFNCMNCYQPAYSGPVSGVGIAPGMGPNPTSTADPLLLPDAPATLIGWADHQATTTGTMTINGNDSTGVEEAIVQAPLDLNFSDTVQLPPNTITGRVIDIQSQNNSIQISSSNTYTMQTGSMTFEFTLPGITHLGSNTLTVTEPTNLQQMSGPPLPTTGPVIDANHLHAYLYNWQTGSWDSFTFNQYVFSTRDAQSYINSDGRVLLQLANQETSPSAILFSKPSLQLQDNGSY